MFEPARTYESIIFKVDKLLPNTVVCLKNPSTKFYLSCHSEHNVVDYFPNDDGSKRQKWMIEKDHLDNTIFYVRSLFVRSNHSQYLGCPNVDNNLYLYTSKNRYTQWKIKDLKNTYYQFTYVGAKFNRNEVSLVVARYNEDVQWTDAYQDIAIIYNKGPPLTVKSRVIELPNIGREGHTYLHHIIENYGNMCNRQIFTQADPFTHNHTFLYGIDNYCFMHPLQAMGMQYLEHLKIPPHNVVQKHLQKTVYGLQFATFKISENMISEEFDDGGMNDLIKKNYKLFPEDAKNNVSLVRGFLTRSMFPKQPESNKITFTYCGLFSVLKDVISKYDRNVYVNLLNELIAHDNHGGTNGYILEKLWLFIFE